MHRRTFLLTSAAWFAPKIPFGSSAVWGAPAGLTPPAAAAAGGPHLRFEFAAITSLRDSSRPLSGVASSPALRRLVDVRSQCDARHGEPARPMLDALRACIERALSGAADRRACTVSVTVYADGSLGVADDGPPLPIGLDPDDGCEQHVRPLLEVWLTEGPECRGGAVPEGLSCLTAPLVAGRCEVHVHADGLRCSMAFEQGIRRDRFYDEFAVDGRRASAMTVTGTTTWRGNVFRFWPHSGRLPFDGTDECVREIDALLASYRARSADASFALVDRRGKASAQASATGSWARRTLRAVPLQAAQTQPVREWARAARVLDASGAQRTWVSRGDCDSDEADLALRVPAGLHALPPNGTVVLAPAGETAVYRRHAVRTRPSMYLGDTSDPRTLVTLMRALVYSVSGPTDHEVAVDIALHPRGAFTVAVDRDELPVGLTIDDPCELRVRPVLEIMLTEDHMALYTLPNGALRWHNFSAYSAWTFMVHVCRRFAVRVHRERIYQLDLDRGLRIEDPLGPPGPDGRPTHPMRELGPTTWRGVEFVVQPDEDIFATEALRIEAADVARAFAPRWLPDGEPKVALRVWRDGALVYRNTQPPAAPESVAVTLTSGYDDYTAPAVA